MSLNTPAKYRRIINFKPGTEPSMTEMSHAKSCDIHNIMKKYEKTGVLDHVSQYEGSYMDYGSIPDFHQAHKMIAEANSMFETVPARIRADFDNDPTKFVDFMQNPDNREQIEAYGLSASHLPQDENKPKPLPIPPKAGESATSVTTEAPSAD